jgi:hypothetical protein
MTRAALLERIEAALLDCKPLDRDLAETILAGIRTGSVDRAIGLLPSYSHHQKIRAAASMLRFPLECSASEAAEELAKHMRRYHTTAWAREKLLETCPQRIAGKIQGACWEILKAKDRLLSPDYIRKLLEFEIAN